MRAINYYIIVDIIKEEPKAFKGFIVTDKQTNDNRYLKGAVISVGNLVEGIAEGDVVRYDRHAGHPVEWEDHIYQVIKQPDVVIVE